MNRLVWMKSSLSRVAPQVLQRVIALSTMCWCNLAMGLVRLGLRYLPFGLMYESV